MYRPQPVPKVLQRKTSAAPPANDEPKNTPQAPPVYCPQTPIVLQRKAVSNPRAVTAPAVYRPHAKKVVQPKMAAAAQTAKPPKTQPANRHTRNNVVQRVVQKGLPNGTQVIVTSNGRTGRILSQEEDKGRYEVMFVTRLQPALYYTSFHSYDELDLVPVAPAAPFRASFPAPALNPAPGLAAAPAAIPAHAAVPAHGPVGFGMEDDSDDEAVPAAPAPEEEDDGFDGMIRSLPEHVTIAGTPMEWVETDRTWILKPTNGRDYPHVTFVGKANLQNFHFSNARFNSATGEVDVVRKGYVWNGFTRKLMDEVGPGATTQKLKVKGRGGGNVTFVLPKGGREQSVPVAAGPIAIPSVAEMAAALDLRH